MPNIIKVTTEDILNKSVELVRKGGMDVLNARIIAKELGCSIQPVYYHFPTMNNLRAEVKKKIKEIYSEYILREGRSNEKHFRKIGMSYIKFAIEESNFFKVLFMNDDNIKLEINASVDDNFDYILSTITDEYDITKQEALKIYESMWITTHGLAVMAATGFAKIESNQIFTVLTNTFKGLLMVAKKKELL